MKFRCSPQGIGEDGIDRGAGSSEGAPGGGGSIVGLPGVKGGRAGPETAEGLAGVSTAGVAGSGKVKVGGGGTLRLVAGTAGALGSETGGAAGAATGWMGAGATGSGLVAAFTAAGLMLSGLGEFDFGVEASDAAPPPTGVDLVVEGAVCHAGRGAESFFLV